MNYVVGRGQPCPQHNCNNPHPHAHMGGRPEEVHVLPEGDAIDLSPLMPAGTYRKRIGPVVYQIEIHQLNGLVPMTKSAAHLLPHIPENTGGMIMWWPLEKIRAALADDGWRVIA